MTNRLLAVGLYTLTACIGCTFDEKNFVLPSNSNKARQIILKKIPIGTSLGRASEIVQNYGLECTMKQSQLFGDYKNIDFLYCRKQAVQFPFVCDSVWQIAIVHKNSKVVDALVTYGTSCL